MPFTEDFAKVFKKHKRKLPIDEAYQQAIEEANEFGIETFRERKKRNSSFKKQGEDPFGF